MSSILVKIFSGPHLGAEIPLLPGTTVIGSGGSCDLIFQDSTVAERHLAISLPGKIEGIQEITIKTLDAPVLLFDTASDAHKPGSPSYSRQSSETSSSPVGDADGTLSRSDAQTPGDDTDPARVSQERLVEGESSWKPLTPLMMGTTCIAWTFEGGGWGDIGGSAFLAERGFGKETLVPPESVEDGEPQISDSPVKKRTVPLPALFRITIRVLVAILIFLFVFGPCMGVRDRRFERDMSRILKKEGFAFLTVNQTSLGVTVMGIVDTQGDRGRLWNIAGRVDYPVFIDVRVREERSLAVKVALSVRGLFPEVDLEDNDIHIKGYMRDKLIEGASKVWIRSDISHVENISSSMVYAFQVWPVLKDRLIKYNLQNAVLIRFHPGLVQVEGELGFDQRQTLEKVKEEVCEALKSPIAFWDTLTAPGFSPEWNESLGSGFMSRFSPDPALASLYMDSHSAKGIPALTASTPGYKAGIAQTLTPSVPVSSPGQKYTLDEIRKKIRTGEKIIDEKGDAFVVIRDDDGSVEGVVMLDKTGEIQLTPSGQPIVLPPLKDRGGKLIRDRHGKPLFAAPLRNLRGGLVFMPEPGVSGADVQEDSGYTIFLDEDGRVVTGELLRNADGSIKRDSKGRMLLKLADGTVIPVTPVSVAPGEEGRLVTESGESLFLDEEGRLVTGELLRNADGSIKRDAQGRMLLKLADGTVIPVTPVSVAPGDEGRLLVDEEGRLVVDDKGRLVTESGESLFLDEHGRIVTGEL
ncbi:MAG: hypothetical protein HQK66_10150, partial [Desulfamplus sp.]|nr:hypothetical protein [Desulfamplus sp.]